MSLLLDLNKPLWIMI